MQVLHFAWIIFSIIVHEINKNNNIILVPKFRLTFPGVNIS